MTQDEVEVIRAQCWENALHAFGTAYIFEKRALGHGRGLKYLTFLGIGVPTVVGALVLSFGTAADALKYVVPVAAALGVIQITVSVWALSDKWEDSLVFAELSASTNRRLAAEYAKLARLGSTDLELLQQRFDLLWTEDRGQRDLDNRQGISEREQRLGMRAGLRQYQRECPNCGCTPASMQSTDCPVCGRLHRFFPRRRAS